MLGAIVGDIVGSIYEFDNHKSKEFPLFQDSCHYTDDTIMTIAVFKALQNGGSKDSYIDSMKKYGSMFPFAGYGDQFNQWVFSDNREAYNSFGNGSAMRVSSIAWYFLTLEEVEKNAEISSYVTHNHPEGIKGAQATAAAIFLARTGASHDYIRKYIENKYCYDLNRTLNEIRPSYLFNETCQETVPEAIIAFLESVNFEDAIRNAISLGGDSDTLAAITGSIAEVAYGIPNNIKEKSFSFLDIDLQETVEQFYSHIK